jgi:hypothetical protein
LEEDLEVDCFKAGGSFGWVSGIVVTEGCFDKVPVWEGHLANMERAIDAKQGCIILVEIKGIKMWLCTV